MNRNIVIAILVAVVGALAWFLYQVKTGGADTLAGHAGDIIGRSRIVQIDHHHTRGVRIELIQAEDVKEQE